jgi:hypothetical protein
MATLTLRYLRVRKEGNSLDVFHDDEVGAYKMMRVRNNCMFRFKRTGCRLGKV